MVSMVETASHPEHNDTVMDPVVPKSEPLPDGSISSTVSTPDAEAEPLTQDTQQTQKRKGGRKPVRNTLITTSPFPFSFFRACACCVSDAIIRGPAFLSLPLLLYYTALAMYFVVIGSTILLSRASSLLVFLFGSFVLDLCYFGGKEAAQPTGAGCLPRTSYGVYPSARDYDQAQ